MSCNIEKRGNRDVLNSEQLHFSWYYSKLQKIVIITLRYFSWSVREIALRIIFMNYFLFAIFLFYRSCFYWRRKTLLFFKRKISVDLSVISQTSEIIRNIWTYTILITIMYFSDLRICYIINKIHELMVRFCSNFFFCLKKRIYLEWLSPCLIVILCL